MVGFEVGIVAVIALPFILKKFDNQLKELGLSKKDIKIIVSILLVFLLYRHYRDELIKTRAMITSFYYQGTIYK